MKNVVLSTRDIDDFINEVANAVVQKIEFKSSNQQTQPVDKWFDLNELIKYLPDKPKKPTVYSWVHKGIIPHHKRNKKLSFLQSEIDAWLKEGKRKTASEIEALPINYLTPKNR